MKKEIEIPEGYEARIEGNKVILVNSEDERIGKEINTLYFEIDACITELLKARTDKDAEAEGKALFKMEGLMVATLQDLSCIEDYLEKQKEQKSAECVPDSVKFDEGFKTGREIGFREGAESVKLAEWSEEDIKKIRSEEYTQGFNDTAFGGKLKE